MRNIYATAGTVCITLSCAGGVCVGMAGKFGPAVGFDSKRLVQ